MKEVPDFKMLNLEEKNRQKNPTDGIFIVKAVKISYNKRRMKFAIISCNTLTEMDPIATKINNSSSSSMVG